MAHLISLSIDKSKVTQEGKYLNIVINVADETDQYGNSVSAWESQSKEERDAKARRNYVGNGRVLYTEGSVHKTERKDEKSTPQPKATEEFPF